MFWIFVRISSLSQYLGYVIVTVLTVCHLVNSSWCFLCENISLNFQAQAQECILEKSMTDSRKSTITAKVAAQIVEFYKTTLKNLESCHSEELISSRRYKVQ